MPLSRCRGEEKEERRWVGGGGVEAEAEGKTIHQEAWGPAGLEANPGPNHGLLVLTPAPTPLRFPQVLESFFSERRGGGGGGGDLCLAQAGGCFLSCWSHRTVRGGAAVPGLWNVRGELRSLDTGEGLVAAHPGPLTPPPRRREEGSGQTRRLRAAGAGSGVARIFRGRGPGTVRTVRRRPPRASCAPLPSREAGRGGVGGAL